MERDLEHLVQRLSKTFGERLKSVILYGSSAAGGPEDKFSDYNILCVLAEITPRELADANPIVRWWREKGNLSPLLLSEEEVRNSTDCFAIEFQDMTQRRRVLWGADSIAGLEIDRSFYRAQVEYELRSKLLRLRQKAAGALDDKAQLRIVLADSLSTFCVLFRHALLLHGAEAALEKRQVIAQSAARFGIDAEPFNRLLELRDEKIKPGAVEPLALLAGYMRQIQRVIDAVDRLAK